MEIQIKETAEAPKKKLVAFELPELWYQELKKGSDEEMVSVSNLIRKILYKHYIEEKLTSGKDD